MQTFKNKSILLDGGFGSKARSISKLTIPETILNMEPTGFKGNSADKRQMFFGNRATSQASIINPYDNFHGKPGKQLNDHHFRSLSRSKPRPIIHQTRRTVFSDEKDE